MTSQQIQYGGRLPYWKSLFSYISTIYRPINAKFGKKKHNHVQLEDTWPKYQISKIQDGGQFHFKFFSLYLSQESSDFNEIWCADANFGSIWWPAAILKIVFGYISTIYWPFNVKFGMKKQDHVRHRSRDQNAKFWKFKVADRRHFENGLIAIFQPIIIRFQWSLVCRGRNSF